MKDKILLIIKLYSRKKKFFVILALNVTHDFFIGKKVFIYFTLFSLFIVNMVLQVEKWCVRAKNVHISEGIPPLEFCRSLYIINFELVNCCSFPFGYVFPVTENVKKKFIFSLKN